MLFIAYHGLCNFDDKIRESNAIINHWSDPLFDLMQKYISLINSSKYDERIL